MFSSARYVAAMAAFWTLRDASTAMPVQVRMKARKRENAVRLSSASCSGDLKAAKICRSDGSAILPRLARRTTLMGAKKSKLKLKLRMVVELKKSLRRELRTDQAPTRCWSSSRSLARRPRRHDGGANKALDGFKVASGRQQAFGKTSFVASVFARMSLPTLSVPAAILALQDLIRVEEHEEKKVRLANKLSWWKDCLRVKGSTLPYAWKPTVILTVSFYASHQKH